MKSPARRALLLQLPIQDRACVVWGLQGLSQTKIAELVGIRQPSVSYCLERALQRLEFLWGIRQHTPARAEPELLKHIKDPIDRDILLEFLRTTSQSAVARKMNMSQGRIRYRVVRSINILRTARSEYADVYQKVLDHVGLLWPGTRVPEDRVAHLEKLLQREVGTE